MNDASSLGLSALDALVGQIADEFTDRLNRGEHPSIEEYAQRHPEIASLLREVLPGLTLLRLTAPTEAAKLEVPDGTGILGDFRIVGEVGRGGMGVVYEAQQISLGRRVALKVLPFAATMDKRHLQRFVNEARAAASLEHPHIVPVYGVGCERGIHYYAMRFIAGQSLEALLQDLRQDQKPAAPAAESPPNNTPQRKVADGSPATTRSLRGQASTLKSSHRGRDDWRRIAELALQAAEALEHAHQSGVVHRDVKPANLLLDDEGKLWITDFGLAQVKSDTRLTLTGDLVGTLRYMGPEQALAKRVVLDHRADIYSLGATLYELLTLKPVFEGSDRQELLRQIAFEEPVAPRRHKKAIPADLETVVLKALQKTPADRYATAQELAEDLRRYIKDEPIRARRLSLKRRLGKWCRRHKLLMSGVALLGIVVITLGGWAAWEHEARLMQAERQRALSDPAAKKELVNAATLLENGNIAEALRALERASNHLEGVDLRSLQVQLDDQRRDVILVARLDEIALQASSDLPDRQRKWSEVDRAYTAVFAAHGVALGPASTEELVRPIRASRVSTHLVLAIDCWAGIKEGLREGEGEPLRALARMADADPWRQKLRDPQTRHDPVALKRLAESEGILAQNPRNLIILARCLEQAGSGSEACLLLRRAYLRYPGHFWLTLELAKGLKYEQVKYLRKELKPVDEKSDLIRLAVGLQPSNPFVHELLGVSLEAQDKLPEAMAAYAEAGQLKPDLLAARYHYRMGRALHSQRKFVEAVAAYREAVNLQPDFVQGKRSLEYALAQKFLPGLFGATTTSGTSFSGLIADVRKEIERSPKKALSWGSLGGRLFLQQKLTQSEMAYRQAILLNSQDPKINASSNIHNIHNIHNLAGGLFLQQRLPEALEANTLVIELAPRFAQAYNTRSLILNAEHKVAQAAAAQSEAVILNDQEAKGNWAWLLMGQGQFAEALKLFEDIKSVQIGWAKRWLQLDGTMPKIVGGELVPPDGQELFDSAEFCQLRCRRYYATAERLYREAFAQDPQLCRDLRADVRYDAACAAAQAGCGKGKDAANLAFKEYARLRRQALEWLRADLSAWRSELAKMSAAGTGTSVGVRYEIQQWLNDPALEGLRTAAALAILPEAERRDWEAFWNDVAVLLRLVGDG